MRKFLICVAFAATAAWACGDKILLVMGGRFSQINRGRAAAILAYSHQQAAAAIRDVQRQSAIKKAGHRIEIVEDADKLENALRTGKYDVVMADLTDADQLSQRARSAPSRPVILPVAYNASKTEQNAAQKKFHCLLKAPSDPEQYLAAIDQAMQWKAKGGSR